VQPGEGEGEAGVQGGGQGQGRESSSLVKRWVVFRSFRGMGPVLSASFSEAAGEWGCKQLRKFTVCDIRTPVRCCIEHYSIVSVPLLEDGPKLVWCHFSTNAECSCTSTLNPKPYRPQTAVF